MIWRLRRTRRIWRPELVESEGAHTHRSKEHPAGGKARFSRLALVAKTALTLAVSSVAMAQNYTISTPVGGTTGLPVPTYSGTTQLTGPALSLALDSNGNLFFANNLYFLLYEYSGGAVTLNPPFGQTGVGVPGGMAVDAAGNVFMSDSLQNFIVEFQANAQTTSFNTTVAGSRGARAAFGGDNGPATQASLSSPQGLSIDSKGNIYFADTGNKRVRRISNGIITTIAGGGTLPLTAANIGKAATSVALTGPTTTAVDANGNVYFADGAGSVYEVSATSGILTLAAGCLQSCPAYPATGDGGRATSANLQAYGVALDSNGDLYISEGFGYRVRFVHNGIITTIAGTGTSGTGGDNGPASSAQLTRSYDIAVDSSFRVYVATDSGIRLLTPATSINPSGIVPINSTTPVVQAGSWVSIYGKNLASGTTVWNGDFPTTLGGVSVTIDGKPAYLWLVSPNQINFQAPDDATAGPVSVVVKTPSGTVTSSVTLAAQGPSFNMLGDGSHVAGVILTPQGNGAYGGGTYDLAGPSGSFAFNTRPVKAGETLVLFGVGFGPTTPQVPAGQLFSGAAPTNSPVGITIGGVPAVVSFAGIVGAGLYQINLTAPSNVGSGDQALKATVNNVSTPVGVVVTMQ